MGQWQLATPGCRSWNGNRDWYKAKVKDGVRGGGRSGDTESSTHKGVK